jgi:hypothetical protein
LRADKALAVCCAERHIPLNAAEIDKASGANFVDFSGIFGIDFSGGFCYHNSRPLTEASASRSRQKMKRTDKKVLDKYDPPRYNHKAR